MNFGELKKHILCLSDQQIMEELSLDMLKHEYDININRMYCMSYLDVLKSRKNSLNTKISALKALILHIRRTGKIYIKALHN